jgi:uncharacterized membrane protein YdbT with pleckstrin-like domain
MSYISKHLMPGEVVAREARLSRILYLPAVTLLILSLVAYFAILSAGAEPRRAMPLPAVLLAVALVMAIRASFKRSAVEFAVTNKRVVVKRGFVRQRSSETLLRQVEGITVDQGLFGRIFNYGTIVIEGTGSDRIPYSNIAEPMKFRLCVQEQIYQSAAAVAPAMPHDAEQRKDPYFMLLRMNALKERGIMTDEEFQREKRKILGSA